MPVLIHAPPSIEELFALIAQYDPEYLPEIFELIRGVFRVDQEARRACPLLAEALEQGDPDCRELARLYLKASRAEAQKLWDAQLGSLPEEALEDRLAVLRGPILWGLAEVLAHEGRRLLLPSLSRGLALTELSIRAARRAPFFGQILWKPERGQLVGLAFAFKANALRAQDRSQEARELFDAALRPFKELPDIFDFLPTILSLQASLEIGQREYFTAFRALTDALEGTADPIQKARVHLQLSLLWGHVSEEFSALAEVERASALLSDEQSTLLHYNVAQTRAALLSQMGRLDEAASLLPEIHRYLAELDSPQETFHVRWIEARIAVGQGHSAEGEALYRSVREGFLSLELPYRAAVVTVELARHLFQQGRFQEVAHLAVESVAEFRRQGVEQEVLGAVALLEDAHRGQLSLEIVGQILKRVQRAARER
jgi:tetratricopeptide (TPR) repeat protein